MFETAVLAKSIIVRLALEVNFAPNVRLYTSMFVILCRLIIGKKRELNVRSAGNY